MMEKAHGKEVCHMTVTVDEKRCIACGMCAYAAPEVFRVVGSASTVVAQPLAASRTRGLFPSG